MPSDGPDFSYSGTLTETCLLGNIAKRMDTRIEWDAASMKVTNLLEANRYVRTEYRQGWSLEETHFMKSGKTIPFWFFLD